MDKTRMVSIGTFSRMMGVSAKTLKHLQQIGLLVPDYVDPQSGYRYYSKDQIFQCEIIQLLKQSGFGPREIREYLSRKDLKSLLSGYKAKRHELEDEISRNKEAFEFLLGTIRDIEKVFPENNGDSLLNTVIEEEFPDRRVLFYRHRGPLNVDGMGIAQSNLQRWLKHHEITSCNQLFVLFNEEYDKINLDETDVEYCYGVNHGNENQAEFLKTLKGGTYLTLIYRGFYRESLPCYHQLMDYLKNNNYISAGPLITRNMLQYIETEDPDNVIMQFQLRVEKK